MLIQDTQNTSGGVGHQIDLYAEAPPKLHAKLSCCNTVHMSQRKDKRERGKAGGGCSCATTQQMLLSRSTIRPISPQDKE